MRESEPPECPSAPGFSHSLAMYLGGDLWLLRRNGFEPMKEWVSDAKEARQRDKKAPELKHKVKGYAGLYEFVYYVVCSQTEMRETVRQAQ